ncbi:MAG: hybrid sensor histidine kinase/response regulator [Pseudomonadota bacterium]
MNIKIKQALIISSTIVIVVIWMLAAIIIFYYSKNILRQEYEKQNIEKMRNIILIITNDLMTGNYLKVRNQLKQFANNTDATVLTVYDDNREIIESVSEKDYPKDIEHNVLDHFSSILSKKTFTTSHSEYSLFHKNKELFVCMVPIFFRDDKNEPFGFLVGAFSVSVLHKYLKNLSIFLCVLAMLMLVLQVLVSTKIANNISNSLLSLMRSVKKYSMNKGIPEIRIKSSIFEFNKLACDYNLMAHKVMEAQKSVEKMSKLAAIGQISSQVAHDMRSPVTVIRGYLEGGSNSSLREPAIKSVEKLNRMADELLDYSKASKIEPAKTPFKGLIETTVNSEVQNLAEKKNVKLIYNIEKDITATVDAYRMGRVLINLITNAVQAVKEDTGEVRIAARVEKDALKITVSDNGRGISKEDLAKIFDSFFTKGKSGGTGLGLSYCKNVIEAHGGAIAVNSEPGKGAEFVITIPSCISTPHTTCYMPHAVPSHQASAVSCQPTKGELGSNEDILVVDDDEEMVLLWNDIIVKKYRRPAITAYSPEEVMRLQLDYDKISKAIIDYQFDGSTLSGLDVVKFLREKGVKVIHMCTGMYNDKELQAEAKKLGVASIIPKPFALDINI